MENKFQVVSNFKIHPEQRKAVDDLKQGLKNKNDLTLLGVTGSGKTFTIASLIEEIQKPTLIISHNKTLASQLYGEFKAFFPNNAVEYYVSYYDYYQPEAYVPSTDTYIDKDSQINDEIEKLRHSATASLSERNDVIIVASVSCIYGIGSPEEYKKSVLSLREGMKITREEVIKELVRIQYFRNDIEFKRGTFRVKGDVVDIYPIGEETAVRVEIFDSEIESIKEIDPVTADILNKRKHVSIFPGSYYVTPMDKLKKAIENIRAELKERMNFFDKSKKLIEKQRIRERTNYDLELLEEIGVCKGIENYSRHLNFKKKGERPFTIIDYFPDDFLVVIDESHVMVPQLRGMYNGDRSRKTSLVDYGFRLPSALDNRPLNLEEFNKITNKRIYVSATPQEYEISRAGGITAEQVIRPTGLLDPEVIVRKEKGQVDDLINEIKETTKRNERTLVVTLTKKMSEELTKYLKDKKIKVEYLHSDIDTLERELIIQQLRIGKFDVLVGVNLLREGLDLPEVSLIAIFDADKVGFLRNETSLIQTIGRAARNVNGKVIMYADTVSFAMKKAIDETNRRRKKQEQYNKENNITPKSIIKNLREITKITEEIGEKEKKVLLSLKNNELTQAEKKKLAKIIEEEMKIAADKYDFERAAVLRDRMFELKK